MASIDELEKLLTEHELDDAFLWLDIENASDQEIKELGEIFELHPLTVEDCSLQTSRQKLEPFEKYIFLVFQSLHHIYHFGEVDNPIKIVLTDHYVVTFHKYPSFALEMARSRLIRILQTKFSESVDSIIVFHSLADSISDSDLPIVQMMEEEVNNIEGFIFVLGSLEQTDLLQRMSVARRRMANFKILLSPKKDIIQNFSSSELLVKAMTVVKMAYFRDVYDHVVSMIDTLNTSSEILSSLESTYLAKVSIEVAEASNNVNGIMKKFSSVATIILPLSLIAGLWGMNITVPFQQVEGETPFYVMVSLMTVFAIIIGWWFKIRNWL